MRTPSGTHPSPSILCAPIAQLYAIRSTIMTWLVVKRLNVRIASLAGAAGAVGIMLFLLLVLIGTAAP